jgi:Protein of unknown function (DUF2894)
VTLAAAERALDALESQGARLFDAASCDCVRTLITRAEQLGGRARELLAERAVVHAERLRERFERGRAASEQSLTQLEQQRGRGPLAALRERLVRGDVTTVRRKLRRLASAPIKAVPSELARPARARRGRSADAYDSQQATDYEEALAELVASFALARAVDVVPEHAGPYNPLRIASDLLARMRTVSPIYLTAQLNRLEELASMLELPELPEPSSKTLPRKKRRVLRSGS